MLKSTLMSKLRWMSGALLLLATAASHAVDFKTVGAAPRDLDLTETALRGRSSAHRVDRTQGRTGLSTAEREELARLPRQIASSRRSATS